MNKVEIDKLIDWIKRNGRYLGKEYVEINMADLKRWLYFLNSLNYVDDDPKEYWSEMTKKFYSLPLEEQMKRTHVIFVCAKCRNLYDNCQCETENQIALRKIDEYFEANEPLEGRHILEILVFRNWLKQQEEE